VVTPRPVERPPFRPGRYAPLRPDDRHHKIDHDPQVLADSLVDMFLKLNPSDLRDVAQPELKPTLESPRWLDDLA
jgi:hypothetical protein